VERNLLSALVYVFTFLQFTFTLFCPLFLVQKQRQEKTIIYPTK
jgi:hypothetical protein